MQGTQRTETKEETEMQLWHLDRGGERGAKSGRAALSLNFGLLLTSVFICAATLHHLETYCTVPLY